MPLSLGLSSCKGLLSPTTSSLGGLLFCLRLVNERVNKYLRSRITCRAFSSDMRLQGSPVGCFFFKPKWHFSRSNLKGHVFATIQAYILGARLWIAGLKTVPFPAMCHVQVRRHDDEDIMPVVHGVHCVRSIPD